MSLDPPLTRPRARFDIERELHALYGSSQLITRGTVHVVHATRADDGVLHALRVGDPGAPHSETDFFVLNLCRARADVILTSAENLRREPTLGHQLQGPWAEALAQYRSHVLGKRSPLVCAILTRTGDVPDQHPFWNDGTRKLMLCPAELASVIAQRFAGRAEVIGIGELTARSACAWLHQNGQVLISVEAGPSTARQLYEPPPVVDELLLTLWQRTQHAATLAGPLPEDRLLFYGLQPTGHSIREEAGETFRFERWRKQG